MASIVKQFLQEVAGKQPELTRVAELTDYNAYGCQFADGTKALISKKPGYELEVVFPGDDNRMSPDFVIKSMADGSNWIIAKNVTGRKPTEW